jgi:hypothetical protein
MRSLNVESLDALRVHIANLSDAARRRYDSFTLSPAYYALTGRLGGYISVGGGSQAVTCIHPNMPDVQLIFPDIGEKPSCDLGLRLAVDAVQQGRHPQFARLTAANRSALLGNASLLQGRSLQFLEFEETVLDWRFPVHILDTALICDRKGGIFKRLRLQLRKISRHRLSVADYCREAHASLGERFFEAWCAECGDARTDAFEIASPGLELLKMNVDQMAGLRQQLILLDGRPSGLCVWEQPVVAGDPASLLSIVSLRSACGLAEWQMVLLCERLKGLNITRLDIGGSETYGLDRYKRKFRPCESHELYSVAIADAASDATSSTNPYNNCQSLQASRAATR